MSLLHAHFNERARAALRLMEQSPLPAAVRNEVDAFFARNKDIKRDAFTEAFITSLVLEGLSTATDSQSAAQPQAKQTKVA